MPFSKCFVVSKQSVHMPAFSWLSRTNFSFESLTAYSYSASGDWQEIIFTAEQNAPLLGFEPEPHTLKQAHIEQYNLCKLHLCN